MNQTFEEFNQPASDDDVPAIIRAAGDAAVCAYREFLDDAAYSPGTRRVYRTHIRRFCHWAEACGLPLELLAGNDIAAFIQPVSHKAASDVVSALRGLFASMVAAGVLTDNPCGRRLPRAYKGPVRFSPDRLAWELRAMHRELMAALDERYGNDPTYQLLKSINRQAAVMEINTSGQVAEKQDAFYAR